MKNIFLIAFFLLTLSINICAQTGWFPEFLVTGEKLDFNYLTIQSTQKQNKLNYGLGLSSQKLIPNGSIQIKAGTLTLSGSISRLNNPALSTSISPFSSFTGNATGLCASLPSHSSFSNPVSFFADTQFCVNKNSSLMIDGVFIPENKLTAFSAGLYLNKNILDMSLITGILQKNKKQIAITFTGGLFPLPQVSESSWLLKNDYYNACFVPAFQNQMFFSWKNILSLNTINLYFSPFNDIYITFRTENTFKLNRTKISASSFYNYSSDYVTPSLSRIDEMLQLKINILTQKINAKNQLYKNGVTIFADLDLYNEEHNFKLSTGGQITGKNFSFCDYITCSLSYSPYSSDFFINDFSFYNKNSYSLNSWTFRLNETLSFSPPAKNSKWKSSQKINLQISKNGVLSFNSGGTLEISQKDWTDCKSKISLSASVTYKPKIKGKPELYSAWSEEFK